MEPIVRLTRPDDINSITTIDLKCYHYPMSMKSWQELLNGSGKRGQARVVVTEVYRKPAGYAMWTFDEDHTGILHRVGVLPKFRRNGIGTVLVAAALKHSFENHVDTMRITVPDIHCCPGDVDDVSAFLNACEFNTTGEIVPEFKTMYGELVDGYVFQRGTHALTKRR